MIVANVAVGKSWADVATPILAAYAPVITVLLGFLDLFASQFGTAVLSSDLSAQARFAVDALAESYAALFRRVLADARQ